MVASLALVVAAAMGGTFVANRFNPVRRVASDSRTRAFPSRSNHHQLQMQVGANGDKFPNGWAAEWPAQFSRADSGASHLTPLRANRQKESRAIDPSRPRLFGWGRRLRRGSPVMNVEGERPLTPQAARVARLRKNLQALDGSSDEGRPILEISLSKFDELECRYQLSTAVDAAEKMSVLLMLNAQPSSTDPRPAAQLAAIRRAEEFNDVLIHTQLTLEMSDRDDALQKVDFYAEAGSDIITFQPDSASTYSPTSASYQTLTAILERIKSHGILNGLVVNPQTSVSDIEDLLRRSKLEMVVIKLVKPVLGGKNYIDEAVGKIQEIKKLCKENMVPEPYISVDGEVDEVNAPKFLAEGVNVIVAGFSAANVDAVAEAVATADPGAARAPGMKIWRTNSPPDEGDVICWLDPDMWGQKPSDRDEYLCSDRESLIEDVDPEGSY